LDFLFFSSAPALHFEKIPDDKKRKMKEILFCGALFPAGMCAEKGRPRPDREEKMRQFMVVWETIGRRFRVALDVFCGILSAPGGMGRLIP